jgi:TolB-like protein
VINNDNNTPGFFERLKQHHIYRVVVVYAVVAGFLIQLGSRVLPAFGWGNAFPAFIIVLLAGFPVALTLAWMLIKPKDPAKYSTWQKLHWKLGAVLSLVVVIIVVISGFYAWHYSMRHAERLADEQAATIPTPKSIAVLPFENLSIDKSNAYFADGMQDLILTKLADIGDLKVVSRTSTMKYASHPDDLKTIAQQLGVATILEGSVQKAGNQVLINVQLIDADTDHHIWAEAYTRTLDNIFGVEGEVASKIADALKAKLSPEETARLAAVPTENQAAYDLFLRAEFQLNRGDINYDTASWKAAIPLYRQAIDKDPKFALAWARLSYAESELAWFGGGGENVKQLTAQARADAERALALAPDLAASQRALGFSEYWGRGDYASALKAFAVALALRPNDADTLAARGYVERRQGRLDAAIASLQQALALDPRNSQFAFELGSTYAMANRFADAETWYQQALSLDPDNFNAKFNYSLTIVLQSGDIPHALIVAQGDEPLLKLQRVLLLTWQRKYNEALTLLASIPDTPDNFITYGGSKALQMANLYRLAGDKAHAQPLFMQAVSGSRTQLDQQQGINLAFVWQYLASAELGLGQTASGLEAVAKSQAILAKNHDQTYGPRIMELNAALYAQAKRPGLAVPLLAKALASPGIGIFYSPVLIWLDPAWDPIRKDPGFLALLKKYAQDKPSQTASSD